MSSPPGIGTKVSKSRLRNCTGCWGVEMFRSACPVTDCSRDTRTLLAVSRRSCADLRTSAPARRYARQLGRGLGGENDAPLHCTFLRTAGQQGQCDQRMDFMANGALNLTSIFR